MSIEKVGKGIEYSLKDNVLLIRVKLDADYGFSKSGKSIIIGTTQGAEVIGGAQVNINVYKPAGNKKPEPVGEAINMND